MIEVKNLVKDYGKHHAVKDISFSFGYPIGLSTADFQEKAKFVRESV